MPPVTIKQKDPGFFYGYIIVMACFLVQGIGVGSYIAYGVFFKPLLNEFGWSRATISGASSMAFLLMGFLGILIGNFNDRFGPRMLMTVSALFFGLSYVLLSRMDAIWQLYLFYGLVGGMGLSAVDVIPLTTTARWFLSRRGMMTGFVKAGTGAGQMTMPFLAGLFIMEWGWRRASVVIGIVALLLLVGAAQLLRRDPSQVGQFPDGRVKPVARNIPASESGFSLRQAFRNVQFWMLSAVNLLAASCMLTVLVHIVAHATDIGIDTLKAAGILSTIGGVSMAGRLCVGFTIDRIGAKKCLIGCLILLIASLLWLHTAKEAWTLYLFAAVYGIAHGGIFTVMSPIVAEFFGIRSHGALFGIVAFTGTVGGSVGPVMAGLVYDITHSYRLIFVIMVGLAATALSLTLLLKPAIPNVRPDTDTT